MLNQQRRNILCTFKFNFYSAFPCVHSFSGKEIKAVQLWLGLITVSSIGVIHIFFQKLTRFSLSRYPSVLTRRLRVPNPFLNSLTHMKVFLLLCPNNGFGYRVRHSTTSLQFYTNPHVTPLRCRHLTGTEEVMQRSLYKLVSLNLSLPPFFLQNGRKPFNPFKVTSSCAVLK